MAQEARNSVSHSNESASHSVSSKHIFPSSEKYSSLSRYINLMFILNATMFISSKLIVTHGYWFPLVAAILFVVVYFLILAPWTDLKSTRLYVTLFILTAVASYFTIASVIYWIQHHANILKQ